MLTYRNMGNKRRHKMAIKQKEINRVANKVSEITTTLREAQKMACCLYKEGDEDGICQLRGAFSGTLEEAQIADGLFTGLLRTRL